MATLEELIVRLDADTERLRREMKRAERSVEQTSRKMDRSFDGIEKAIARAGKQMRVFASGAGIGAVIGALGLSGVALIRTADQVRTLEARVRGATRESGDFARVWTELTAVSSRTGTALETNVQLFQQLAIGAREFGGTSPEILKVTELVQKLGVIGGSSSAAISAGATQFAQAMAGGVLRAEEFNSIVENLPEVAVAIAQGLGKSVGQLRLAVNSGEVLADQVFKALLDQSDQVNTRFGDMPLTLDRAMSSAGTAVSELVFELDRAIGASDTLAAGFEAVAEAARDITHELTKSGLEKTIDKLAVATDLDRIQSLRGGGAFDPGAQANAIRGRGRPLSSEDLSAMVVELSFMESVVADVQLATQKIRAEEEGRIRQFKSINAEHEKAVKLAEKEHKDLEAIRKLEEREAKERLRAEDELRRAERERGQAQLERLDAYMRESLRLHDSEMGRIAERQKAEEKAREELHRAYERNAREQMAVARRAAEEQARAVEHSSERVVDFSADAFDRILAGGTGTFTTLGEEIVVIMRRTFAQVAAEAVIRPVVQPVVQGAIGGLSQGVFGGVGSSVGSSLVGQFLPSPTSLLPGAGLGFAGIGQSLAATFGLGSTAASAGFTSIGAIGAAPAAGAGLGISTGAATALGIGAVAAPLVLGALAFGGLGGKPSVGPNAGARLRIGPDGRFAIGETGADNGGSVASIIGEAQAAMAQLNALLDATGGTASYGNATGDASFAVRYFADRGGVTRGAGDVVRDIVEAGYISGLPSALQQTILTKGVDTALQSLEVSQSIEQALLAITDPMAAALKALEAEHEARMAAVEAAGGNVVAATELFERQRLQVIERFAEDTTDTVRANLAEGLLQLETQLSSTRATAARFFGGLSDPLRALRERLQQTELGGLAPGAQLANARTAFAGLTGRALGGDVSAIEGFVGQAETLLAASRAVNATGPGYAADVARVQADIGRLLASLESTQRDSFGDLAEAFEQSLQQQTATLAQAVNEVTDELSALRRQMAA